MKRKAGDLDQDLSDQQPGSPTRRQKTEEGEVKFFSNDKQISLDYFALADNIKVQIQAALLAAKDKEKGNIDIEDVEVKPHYRILLNKDAKLTTLRISMSKLIEILPKKIPKYGSSHPFVVTLKNILKGPQLLADHLEQWEKEAFKAKLLFEKMQQEKNKVDKLLNETKAELNRTQLDLTRQLNSSHATVAGEQSFFGKSKAKKENGSYDKDKAKLAKVFSPYRMTALEIVIKNLSAASNEYKKFQLNQWINRLVDPYTYDGSTKELLIQLSKRETDQDLNKIIAELIKLNLADKPEKVRDLAYASLIVLQTRNTAKFLPANDQQEEELGRLHALQKTVSSSTSSQSMVVS